LERGNTGDRENERQGRLYSFSDQEERQAQKGGGFVLRKKKEGVAFMK